MIAAPSPGSDRLRAGAAGLLRPRFGNPHPGAIGETHAPPGRAIPEPSVPRPHPGTADILNDNVEQSKGDNMDNIDGAYCANLFQIVGVDVNDEPAPARERGLGGRITA